MRKPQRKPLPTHESSEQKPSKLQILQSQMRNLEAEMVLSSPRLFKQQSLTNQELILRKLDALEVRVKDLEIDEDDLDPDYPTDEDVASEGGEAPSPVEEDDEDDIDLE